MLGLAGRRVHLVGIGGAGMSGIAELLADEGARVSGSDAKDSEVLDRLRKRGVQVRVGHDPMAVEGADAVVRSSAVADANVELSEARRRGLPVLRRAEMLRELLRLRHAIVVAGSHGKTTTTALLATVLAETGHDPTAVVGATVRAWGGPVQVGGGSCAVVEADESDGSFAALDPSALVLTNLEAEHLDAYGGSFGALTDAFVAFAERVPFYGPVVACVDDPGVRSVVAQLSRPFVGYGFAADAQVRASDVMFAGPSIRFRAWVGERPIGVELDLLGRHNVRNALAALATAVELGTDPEAAAAALSRFEGVDRRFTIRAEAAGVIVADDYGHHPTEIATTLEGIRAAYPNRNILVGFQPHRFSRTRDLLRQFGACFEGADAVWIVPVYPAGEADDPSLTADAIAAVVRESGHEAHGVSIEEMETALADRAREGDIVLLLGAGDVHRSCRQVIERLGARRP